MPNGIPGNCHACMERYEALNRDTPCRTCPKYLIYPENYGLMPANSLAVQMYYMASRDHRAGMDAVLIGTLTPADAWTVLNGYDTHFRSQHEKQRTFELMTVLDQVATKTRGETEDQKRRDAMRQAESGRSNRRR